jgi:hypothetical protein
VGKRGAAVGLADGAVVGSTLGANVVRIHGRDGTGVGGVGMPVVGLLRNQSKSRAVGCVGRAVCVRASLVPRWEKRGPVRRPLGRPCRWLPREVRRWSSRAFRHPSRILQSARRSAACQPEERRVPHKT